MKSWRNIFIVLGLLFSWIVLAHPYQIQKIDIRDGLSNNQVVSITQDQKGFMWFATESGLNRFDGKNLKIYQKNKLSNTSISSNELNKVLADPVMPVIWIATQRDGLNSYNYQENTFEVFVNDPENHQSIVSNDITDIVFDNKANLWISTYHEGFDYYDKETDSFTHYNQETLPNLPSNQIWTLADNHDGKLYIGHVKSGLTVMSLKDNTLKNYRHDEKNPQSIPDDGVQSILIDKFENIWIGTNKGLTLFNQETENFVAIEFNGDKLRENKVFSIKQMSDNKIWVGLENGGIFILNVRSGMFQSPDNLIVNHITDSNDAYGLSNSTVRDMYEDSFHNIWIGTWNGGVNFISHKPLFFNRWEYSPLDSRYRTLTIKEAWGLCEDDVGNIWVGTDGGGIQVFKDDERIKIYTKENSALTDNAILASLKDSDGDLWFGTYSGGITVYSKEHKLMRKFSHPAFYSNNIRCLYEDNHVIYIGSDDKGLYTYNRETQSLKHYTLANSDIPEDELVRAVCKDDEGNLWVGSFGEGLNILNKDYRLIRHFGIAQGFYSNLISYIFRDSKNQMWVATGEGLVLFPKDTHDFIIYTEENGLINSHIKAIAEDQQGNIWFSTEKGIGRWSPDEKRFFHYDQYDGIPQGVFMRGAVLNSQKGILYFGSQNGVCYFDPQQLPAVTTTPSIVITGLYVDAPSRYNSPNTINAKEAVILSSKPVNLNYTQHTFTISFNVMDYSFANRVEYAYQLEGLSKEWYSIGKLNEITFRNLRPGKYIFSVKSKTNNQDWSREISSASIIIHPPFWLTWWARMIYVITAMSLILYILRFYKKRLQLENSLHFEKLNNEQQQKMHEEKLQFYTNLTHELRTPLSLIIGPLEDLSFNKNISTPISKKLSLIHQNATRLLELINKLLDFRKTETNNMPLKVQKRDLSKLLKEIGLKYTEFNQNNNINFNVRIETDQTILYFDYEKMYTIVDNLISNAFKYTKAGEIIVSMRTIEDDNKVSYTEIEVKDTGCGMLEESTKRIFERYYQEKNEFYSIGSGIGLALVKSLAQLHQADVLVESELNKGSVFKVRLITNNIYPHASHESEKFPQHLQSEPLPEEFTAEPVHNGTIILIIDDNIEIVRYLEESLSDEFIVLTADNGKRGLEIALDNIPDVIISDVMMPGFSGFELCALLKKDIRTSHIPVILLTAKSSTQDKTEGYSVGADSYITKPFSSNLLKSRIVNILKSREIIVNQIAKSNIVSKQKSLINSLSSLDNEFIEKITDVVKKNCYSDKLDIEFIAQQLNMSHSTLYRKIKAITGFSINEFIRKVKMQYAEELLLTGRYTISEIAFHVGFNSINYFRQCFKEEFGSPPTEHVKKYN